MSMSGSSGTTMFTGGPSLANSAGLGTNFSAIQFGTASTFAGLIDGSQRWGIGVGSPTAFLHVKAGTTTIAPLKLTANSSMLTTPTDGAIEYDGTNLYITVGSVRKALAFV
jgi:hypothetical protein